VTVSDAGAALLQPQPKHHLRFGPHNLRMAFRRWRRSRPFWGGLWAILGGGMMMLGPLTAIRFVLVAGQSIWIGILIGLLVSIFGLYVWFAPSMRQITAILIVVLSVVSFITSDFGGFMIGMVLGVLGGSMAFAWVPMEPKVRKHRLLRRHAAPQPEPALLAVTGTAVPTIAPEREVPELPVQSEAVQPAEQAGEVPAAPDDN